VGGGGSCQPRISFVWNYLAGGERQRVGLAQLMTQPYGRIVVLHLAILGADS
jgi:ABC-type hemin transport system ATPase subunit